MFKEQKGQTLIETALILTLLLLILLGISEFARAWYMKNSLKNGVRQGARVAAVTLRSNLTPANFICNEATNCPNANSLINAVCCQPGVPRKAAPENTTVTLTCIDSVPPNNIITCNTQVTANDTVRVEARTRFITIVHSFSPWLRDITITTDASMRYE